VGRIKEVMDVLYVTKQGKHMNTLKKFHIHLETLKDNQMHDMCTVKPNHLFDVIIKNKLHI
jgi:hypothetical protein